MLACCNYRSTRCLWARKPPFTMPPCEKHNLLSMLRWLSGVLSPDIEWMLTAGTLLGAVRNQSHILHEADIDLIFNALQWETVQRQINARVGETHFKFEAKGVYNDVPGRMFFSDTNSLHVDFWLLQQGSSPNIMIETMPTKKWGFVTYEVDREVYYPIAKCTYEDDIYPCPHQAQRWIEMRYGTQWRVPRVQNAPGYQEWNGKPLYEAGDGTSMKIRKTTPTDMLRKSTAMDRAGPSVAWSRELWKQQQQQQQQQPRQQQQQQQQPRQPQQNPHPQHPRQDGR